LRVIRERYKNEETCDFIRYIHIGHSRLQEHLLLNDGDVWLSNYPLFRQGKSLDNTLVSTLLTVLMAHHIFVMRAPDRQKLLDRSHQPITAHEPRPWGAIIIPT